MFRQLIATAGLCLLTTMAAASPLPKPWYQSNPHQFESGLIEETVNLGSDETPISNTVAYLKSMATPTESGSINQHISPIDEWLGHRVRLSARIKTDLTQGHANLFINMRHGYGFKTEDAMENRELTGRSEWQRVAIVFDVPEQETANLVFGLAVDGEGVVYVDDFLFELADDEFDVTRETFFRGPLQKPQNLSLDNQFKGE